MDVGRAFTFAFEDPDWAKKLLVGGALLLVPIFGWLVVGGYWMRIIRNTHAGHDVPLPEWNEFGEDFILGLKGVAVLLVWWSPYVLLVLTMICLSIPLMLAGSSDNAGVTVPLAVFGAVGWIGAGFVSLLFQIVMLAIQPMILGRIAVTGSLASGFEIGEIMREMRRVPAPLLIVVGLEYGIRSVVGFGVLFCIVGVAFTYFAGFAVLSQLYGQLRRAVEEGNVVTAGPDIPA